MKILRVFDNNNYKASWNCFKREAVRAIIIKDNKLALVKCEKEGYYKFPGGGIEAGESHMEALIRETLEETGLHIVPESIHGFGTLLEKRRSIYGNKEIFEQYSHYYFADVSEEMEQLSLDEYEMELGYYLEFTDIETARQTNILLDNNYESDFLLREAYIMELLLAE